MMNIFNYKNNKKGAILITSLLVLGVLLILSAYFIIFNVTEAKISRSQIASIQSYYLAEAGVNEVIWRIKNDWETDFETTPDCVTFSSSTISNDLFFPNSSYEISIGNSNCARGEIIATSTIFLNEGKTAQRIIKTEVFKATGSLTEDSPIFSGGSSENIDMFFSKINIYNGNIFSNKQIKIKLGSDVYVEKKTLSTNQVQVDWFSSLTTEAICSDDECQAGCDIITECPPSSVSIPIVDFESADSNSYKSQAQSAEDGGNCEILCNGTPCSNECVFDEDDFEDLLWQIGQDGEMEINNKVTYIDDGKIDLRGGKHLIVNGVLVADKNIDIGRHGSWGGQSGPSQITINDPGLGEPSGLFTQKNIYFGVYSSFSDIFIDGLIYATLDITFTGIKNSLELTGGMVASKLTFSSISFGKELNFYLDNDMIKEGVWGTSTPPATTPYSPVVIIDHWEESY